MSTHTLQAQPSNTATARISASVISLLAPEQPLSMDIDDIIVSTESSGSIIISPGGGISTSGGVTITSPEGAPLAITLSGSGDYVYSVTLPESITIPGDETGITISDFTSSESNVGQLNSGSKPIFLGATVNLPKAEEEGSAELQADVEIGINFN